jgi:hypothetical protein
MAKTQELLNLADENGIITSKVVRETFPEKSQGYANNLLAIAKAKGLIQPVHRGIWRLVKQKTSSSEEEVKVEVQKKSLSTLLLTREEKEIFDLIFGVKSKTIKNEVRFIEKELFVLAKKKGFSQNNWENLRAKLINIGIIRPRCIANNGEVLTLNEDLFIEYSDNPDLIKLITDEEKVIKKIDDLARDFSQKIDLIDDKQLKIAQTSERIKAIDEEKTVLEKDLERLYKELESLQADETISTGSYAASLRKMEKSTLQFLLKIIAEV